MPSSKSPESYPAIYSELAIAVAESGETGEMELPTQEACISFRQKWYAWRAAIKEEVGKGREELAGLYATIQGLSLTAPRQNHGEGTWTVYMIPIDSTDETRAGELAIAKLKAKTNQGEF